jgi:adenine/guanine phosphoribosyltransferase-like PRPP-binding protein
MKQTILSSQCDFGVNGMTMGTIVEDRELRQKRFVFRDRADAGRQLLRLMGTHRGKNTIVLAIPSGGLPVAAEIAKGLDVPLDVVIVRKLQIPRNKEAGLAPSRSRGIRC